MRMELSLRPDYASIVPWLESSPDGVVATAGPDAFSLSTTLPLEVQDGTARADFVVPEGARERLTLSWHRSYGDVPPVEDADSALARTDAWWREWSGRCTYDGPYRDEVLTSLIALKAMTYEATGAVIAAPTTSLPEDIGGERNWDYRYCWLRDSVLALEALLVAGYTEEAVGFRDYLLRIATGDPTKIQIMYGIAGERRLTEFEVDELPGYEGSKPSESATRPQSSSSSTSTARSSASGSWARPFSARWRKASGPVGARPSSMSRRSGASPTTGSGNRGALGATTRTPR